MEKYGEAIIQRIKEEGIKPGMQDFIGRYQLEVSADIDALSDEEKEELERIAQAWTDEGRPEAVKVRYVPNSQFTGTVAYDST